MKEMGGNLTASGLRFAVAVSRFNDLLTRQLLAGAEDCLLRHGAAADAITAVWVPGANELSLAADLLARSEEYDAVIALGAVIQGATPHADLINGQVSRSLARSALDTGLPVINGVICAQNLEQAIERSGTKAGNKGWQAAMAAIEMANLCRQLRPMA